MILATDKGTSSVFRLNLGSNQADKLTASFSEPENIATFDSGFYVQTKDGVVRLDSAGEKATTVANNASWGQIVGAAGYTTNLYLLDKGKGEIWRYFGSKSGLSSGQAYISGDKPDLSDASAISIDGLVWVTTHKGNIYKFAQGKKQDFSLSNLNDSLGDIVDIYTSPDTKNHYLLDQGKGRVVIVSKDGVYQAQYSHQNLHQATSLVVQEDRKTVYFAANGKLYSFKFR